MKLQQVIYAIEIYRQGSYTKAAQVLYVSQPRLSIAIQELEEELGFDIFERTRHGIRGTTTRGYAFIQQALKAVKSFELLENFSKSSDASLQISTTIITQAQDAFKQLCINHIDNSKLDVGLWFSGCFESADRVRTGVSDIGIVTILHNQYDEWMGLLDTMKLQYRELHKSRFYATMSKDSALGNREELCFEDFAGYTFITEKCSRMNDLTLDVYSQIDAVCPEARVTISDTDIMYSILNETANNRSFVLDAVAPSVEVLSRYDLVSIPITDEFTISLGYITRKNEELSALGKEYIELLEEYWR